MSGWPMYRALVGVGLCCGLLIVAVFAATEPVIRHNKIAARQRAVLEVLPGAARGAAFHWNGSGFERAADDAEGDDLVFAGYDAKGQLRGVAVGAAGMGYQDVIRLLYGYDPAQQVVVGISVLESRETPGLGDGIESDPGFARNFERLDVALDAAGEALVHRVAFVKSGQKQAAWEIDGITGATISSRAVANMLSASTALWMPRIARRLADLEDPARSERR